MTTYPSRPGFGGLACAIGLVVLMLTVGAGGFLAISSIEKMGKSYEKKLEAAGEIGDEVQRGELENRPAYESKATRESASGR